MKYRYYVHDLVLNVGITEFTSTHNNHFMESLVDIINWGNIRIRKHLQYID